MLFDQRQPDQNFRTGVSSRCQRRLTSTTKRKNLQLSDHDFCSEKGRRTDNDN